jgi:ribulose-5-phosphate 4-epimerase/fuculose-1-phosphate aldolase
MTVTTTSVAVEPADSEQAPTAEWAVRCDLAAAYQLIDLFGMSNLGTNHLSARVPGSDSHFFLNPLGTLFDQITASSLIKVDMDGGLVEGDKRQLNRAGFVIHSAVYLARPDITSVVHTHTRANNAIGALAEGLLPLNLRALSVLPVLRYHDLEGTGFDIGERERIAADLGEDGRVLLLRNHGALAVGRSIPEAWGWHYKLEGACQYQVDTFACVAGGLHINQLSEELIARIMREAKLTLSPTGAMPTGDLEWASLLVKLERERGMSYKT